MSNRVTSNCRLQSLLLFLLTRSIRSLSQILALTLLIAGSNALAQHGDHAQSANHGQHGEQHNHGEHHAQHMMHSMDGAYGAGSAPQSVGQSGFSAIQEIVAQLQADPSTDWSEADIDALREHLIDMDRIMMNATVGKTELDQGMRYELTGDDLVSASIKRMVPAHAQQMRSELGWDIEVRQQNNGVVLEITSPSDEDVLQIKGLGFAGFMVLGDHHQNHHLHMAKGGQHAH